MPTTNQNLDETTTPSLKAQADDIIEQAEAIEQLNPQELSTVDKTVGRLTKIITAVDLQAAAERVDHFRAKHPHATRNELSAILIKEKCRRTGTIGALTSSIGLIPGIGTALALILGTATDIGATFKLQAELALELAELYDYPLDEAEKQRLILSITGLSAGTVALTTRVGRQAGLKLTEKYAEKSLLKALPVIGVIGSAGTNVLSTYVIGQRADAYFRLGPEHMVSWQESMRAVTGVDERQIGAWLAEGSRKTGQGVVQGAGRAGRRGLTVGRRLVGGLWWLLTLPWRIITFIPRKIIRFFQAPAL